MATQYVMVVYNDRRDTPPICTSAFRKQPTKPPPNKPA